MIPLGRIAWARSVNSTFTRQPASPQFWPVCPNSSGLGFPAVGLRDPDCRNARVHEGEDQVARRDLPHCLVVRIATRRRLCAWATRDRRPEPRGGKSGSGSPTNSACAKTNAEGRSKGAFHVIYLVAVAAREHKSSGPIKSARLRDQIRRADCGRRRRHRCPRPPCSDPLRPARRDQTPVWLPRAHAPTKGGAERVAGSSGALDRADARICCSCCNGTSMAGRLGPARGGYTVS